jgi:hypothetical protein
MFSFRSYFAPIPRLVVAGVPMDPDEREALLKSPECSLNGRYVGEARHHSHHT